MQVAKEYRNTEVVYAVQWDGTPQGLLEIAVGITKPKEQFTFGRTQEADGEPAWWLRIGLQDFRPQKGDYFYRNSTEVKCASAAYFEGTYSEN